MQIHSHKHPSYFRAQKPSKYDRLEELEQDVWLGFHRLATDTERQRAGLATDTTGSLVALAAAEIDVLMFNRVIGLGSRTHAALSDIDRFVDWYRMLGVHRFFVQTAPYAQPEALSAWLTDRGFNHYNNWAKLFYEIDTRSLPEYASPFTIHLADKRYSRFWSTSITRAFDWPPALEPITSRLFDEPGWHIYVATLEGTVAAAGALYISDRAGYLGPATTLPEFRNRGAQSALITHRIREAHKRGCTLLVTETAEDTKQKSSPSYRNLQRLGFDLAYLRPNYLFTFSPESR